MVVKSPCYTSLLKYVFQLEEKVSRGVQCRRSKLTNSLGKQQLESRLAHDQLEFRERAPSKSVCLPAKSKWVFSHFFSFFEFGGITKHLMTGPRETVSFVSPRPQRSPPALLRGTLRISGKENLFFSLARRQSLSAYHWPKIQCFTIQQRRLCFRNYTSELIPVAVEVLLQNLSFRHEFFSFFISTLPVSWNKVSKIFVNIWPPPRHVLGYCTVFAIYNERTTYTALLFAAKANRR